MYPKSDIALTGTSVPTAMPTMPSGFTSAMLSARLAIAITPTIATSRRCMPAPFKMTDAVEQPTRTMTTTAMIWRMTAVSAKRRANPGGEERAREHAPGRPRLESPSPATGGCPEQRPYAGAPRAGRVAVDDNRKQRLAELIRELQRQLSEPLRRRPERDGRRAKSARR